MSNIEESRKDPFQLERIDNLMALLPKGNENILEIGARDGHLSLLLAEHFDSIHALDLELPQIEHKKITCVKGDVTKLEYDDAFFDVVFCTEVLERIPNELLQKACDELMRVSARYVVIGVPYRQDLRAGQTVCGNCKMRNPPWLHVNTFTKQKLFSLFQPENPKIVEYVGVSKDATNLFVSFLMNIAGNPFGTYQQNEPCIYCNHSIDAPNKVAWPKFLVAKAAALLSKIQRKLSKQKPNLFLSRA